MSQPWYKYLRIDDYASYPDPDGSFPKPDSNILVPDGVPITALASGVVSGINAPDGSQPGFGQVVTVKLDTPLNPSADHMAYLHLNQISCSQGQRVTFGTPVGVAGPSSTKCRDRVRALPRRLLRVWSVLGAIRRFP